MTKQLWAEPLLPACSICGRGPFYTLHSWLVHDCKPQRARTQENGDAARLRVRELLAEAEALYELLAPVEGRTLSSRASNAEAAKNSAREAIRALVWPKVTRIRDGLRALAADPPGERESS